MNLNMLICSNPSICIFRDSYYKENDRIVIVMIRLIQGDCIEEMQKLIDEGVNVDMILTDIPYGTVKGLTLDGWNENSVEWDNTLPTKEMFDCCEKLLRMNGVCILFSQEPYTSYLRQFNPTNLGMFHMKS